MGATKSSYYKPKYISSKNIVLLNDDIFPQCICPFLDISTLYELYKDKFFHRYINKMKTYSNNREICPYWLVSNVKKFDTLLLDPLMKEYYNKKNQ